jgi:hypothetical protein
MGKAIAVLAFAAAVALLVRIAKHSDESGPPDWPDAVPTGWQLSDGQRISR